jgi:ATP-binding cassette subfamily A (ABC1) protein 3
VLAEREKVKHIVESGTLSAQNNAIFISSLKKIYYGKGSAPTKIAVRDVSVSIQHGEVFGLLGANGAGKTTLLKMVSGQEQPSSGFALINGYDVVRNTSEAQRSMGLCPQFDTLVERLTVRENLLFFGQIKGLSGLKLVEVCEAFMAAMNIKRYENKLIQQLSGGNRRKVSLAVALLGAPPTVYLDEPSTGLDPVASRLMWRLLTKISAMKSTAIVLTTHNMLECEAVCTRICIMKLGEMVCLGDSQHLRSAHGTGFLLEMTLSSPEMTAKAKHFVMNSFAHASVVDEHVTMINFEIPRSSIARLSQAFKQLEEKKVDLGIVDYALSQSTLEQVFLKQIRPNDNDQKDDEDQRATERVPLFKDYAYGYFMWALAAVVPGLHHFYLGNTMRGLKYLCTFNEVFAGWLLDGLELHVLVQKSVQQYGHTSGCCGLYKHKEKVPASA